MQNPQAQRPQSHYQAVEQARRPRALVTYLLSELSGTRVSGRVVYSSIRSVRAKAPRATEITWRREFNTKVAVGFTPFTKWLRRAFR